MYNIKCTFLQVRVFNWKYQFYAVIQITLHPVCTAHINFGITCIFKLKNTAVFQEGSYDGTDGNIFTDIRNPHLQAADSADNEFNLHSRRAGFIQGGYDIPVAEGIHLGHDVGLASSQSVFRLPADHAQAARPQPQRRH